MLLCCFELEIERGIEWWGMLWWWGEGDWTFGKGGGNAARAGVLP
jgi:hypothetical protein